jgi:hypothetical protein
MNARKAAKCITLKVWLQYKYATLINLFNIHIHTGTDIHSIAFFFRRVFF